MTYKVQDILRLIIPGLYLLIMVFIILVLIGKLNLTQGSDLFELLKSPFSNLLVVLVPFFGFILGYLINTIDSLVERTLYNRIRVNRPSLKVLQTNSKYVVKDLDKIREKLGITGLDNKIAYIHFTNAKEALIDNDYVNVFYAQAILARNLAGSQLLITLLGLIILCYNPWIAFVWIVISALLLWIMGFNWRRQNCIYAKYVFSEYGKILLKE